MFSSDSLRDLVGKAAGDVVFIMDPHVKTEPGPQMFDRMKRVLEETGAGLVYSDSVGHPRIDYQFGSIRDGFDFGPALAISVSAARKVQGRDSYRWGGLYDLRLRLSEERPIVRIPEALYESSMDDSRPTGEKQFDYVDPRNRDYQIEMEQIATAYLKRIGVYLEPTFLKPEIKSAFADEASVIVPVRNRERTIRDAVRSVLS